MLIKAYTDKGGLKNAENFSDKNSWCSQRNIVVC